MATHMTPNSEQNLNNAASTVHQAGLYQIHASDGRCVVYRQSAGGAPCRMLTMTRAATTAAAVSEARRNVRNARKAGGL